MALQAPIKWVDNVLSHHDIRGVDRAKRGVDRHLSFDAIVALSIVWVVARDLGVPLSKAVDIAEQLLDCAQREITTAGGLRIFLDVNGLAEHLNIRLTEVAETAPRMRRGAQAMADSANSTLDVE
jgi:hypothetical protein